MSVTQVERPSNLRALRESGWKSKTVKLEIRDNFVSALARRGRWRERIDASPSAALVFYGGALLAALTLGAEGGPQFIYFQF